VLDNRFFNNGIHDILGPKSSIVKVKWFATSHATVYMLALNTPCVKKRANLFLTCFYPYTQWAQFALSEKWGKKFFS